MLDAFRALSLKKKIVFIAGLGIALPVLFVLILFLLVRLEVVDTLPSQAEIASSNRPWL